MSAPVVPSRVVLVEKPAGPTSFDMVRMARRGVGARVGHAGTLDPFATGLLLILVGQATRISNLLMALPKEYEVTVQFGARSTTADPTGEISPTGVRTDEAQVRGMLGRFHGCITQKVPLTSAVKVDGEPLYRKAHRGESAERPDREVTVHDLRLVAFDASAQEARLVAVTGSGTYVRTLAEDLGEALGCGAYAATLRRTRSGDLRVDDALAPADLSPQRYVDGGPGILSIDEALYFLPEYRLDQEQARLAANGNILSGTPDGRLRVSGPEGLLGIYEGEGGHARPLAVFARPA